VPWNRLPQIRAIAPEYYNNLSYHTSWTKLLFRFLFDEKLSSREWSGPSGIRCGWMTK